MLWQTSKALAGEHPEAMARDRETSLNPAVFGNMAFITIGAWQQGKFVDVRGHEPDGRTAKTQYDGNLAASAAIRKATRGGGSYSNEGSYFEENWQHEFWGDNYARLLRIKKKYDPTNIFSVHKGVGWGEY